MGEEGFGWLGERVSGPVLPQNPWVIPDELFMLPRTCTSSGQWDRDTDWLACFIKALSVVNYRKSENSHFINLTGAKRILKEWEAFTWS